MQYRFNYVVSSEAPAAIWMDPESRTVGVGQEAPNDGCLTITKIEHTAPPDHTWIRSFILDVLKDKDLLLELVWQFYVGAVIWEEDIGEPGTEEVLLEHRTGIWLSVNRDGLLLQTVVDEIRMALVEVFAGEPKLADGWGPEQKLFRPR